MSEYASKTVMFGDMAKGGHLQTRRIYCDGQPTPIFETSVKKDRNSPWVTSVTWGSDSEILASIQEAIAAWEVAGKPGLGEK